MTHEYGDPINDEAVAAAVARAIALIDETADRPLREAVEQAVHECVCSCAVDIADAVEHRRSGIHAALADEVGRLVDRRMAQAHADLKVDEASRESFPASDPPAWIWQKPSR